MKKRILLVPVLLLTLGTMTFATTSCDSGFCDIGTMYCRSLGNRFHDYARDGSVKLEHDYKGKDFYVDGIGQMDVLYYIDGDTTHFTPRIDSLDKGTVKARYYGIDTPESTGNIEMWGKEASIFTQSCLERAQTIVVSTARNDYGAPETDSTGSRYVSLVWISFDKEDCPYDELILLNLMIVQYGLSWVKSVSSMPQYANTFYDAQDQAEKLKLCLFDPDTIPPHWPGDQVYGLSLFEMQQEVIKDLEAREKGYEYSSPYDNCRVVFSGTVAGYVNNILYLVDYYDMEWLDNYYDSIGETNPYTEGQWAGVNIFVGMSDPASKYREQNTYLTVYGLFQSSEGYGFQVTDVAGHFPRGSYSYSAEDVQIELTPEENIIPAEDGGHMLEIEEYSFEEISAIASDKADLNKWDLLCRRIKLDDYVKVVSANYVKDTGNCYLYFNETQNSDFQVEITFNYKGSDSQPNYQFTSNEDYEGRSFLFSGNLTFHITGSGALKLLLMPNDKSDIIWDQIDAVVEGENE